MSSLPATPPGMTVEMTHDGASWQPRVSPVGMLVAGVIAALGAGGTVGGALFLAQPSAPWHVLGAVAGIVAGSGLMWASYARETISVRPDRVIIERRKGPSRERAELRYVDITEVRIVEPRDDYSGHALRVQTTSGREVFARDAPKAHIEWFRAAIEAGRRRHEAREEEEGKEFFFHRERPAELQDMLKR